GDEDVGPAIAIEVGTDDAQPRSRDATEARFDGHIVEADARRPAVQTLVAKQPAHASLESLGSAVVAFAARPDARPGRVIVHVTDDDQVQPAVAVEIDEGR